MLNLTERRLGYGFGLLGGSLILLGALVSLLVGVVDLALGRPLVALDSESVALVLFVVGGLAMFFAWLTSHEWNDRTLAGGVLLVVLSFVGWAFLGLGANVLALIGALFVLLSGVLFLVEPAKKAATAMVTAS